MKNLFLLLLLCPVMICCNSEHPHNKREEKPKQDSSFSSTVKAIFPPEYYTEQGIQYFRTMETDAPMDITPNYAENVIRFEWYPWLWLTGYGKNNLKYGDKLLRLFPTDYDTIDCRFFEIQPFCRCHVVFNYSGRKIPIYEEFTFNSQGEITFIEAWSDYPGLLPMKAGDYWAEGNQVNRLSVRIPGLGSKNGIGDPGAGFLIRASEKDTVLADLIYRLNHPFTAYFRALYHQYDAIKRAHLPPPGVKFPYHEPAQNNANAEDTSMVQKRQTFLK